MAGLRSSLPIVLGALAAASLGVFVVRASAQTKPAATAPANTVSPTSIPVFVLTLDTNTMLAYFKGTSTTPLVAIGERIYAAGMIGENREVSLDSTSTVKFFSVYANSQPAGKYIITVTGIPASGPVAVTAYASAGHLNPGSGAALGSCTLAFDSAHPNNESSCNLPAIASANGSVEVNIKPSATVTFKRAQLNYWR